MRTVDLLGLDKLKNEPKFADFSLHMYIFKYLGLSDHWIGYMGFLYGLRSTQHLVIEIDSINTH